MRIFDKYTFNIASKVKFKDTKKYVDSILEQMGLSYQNICFTYKGFMTSLEQVLEKYPNLSKYCFEYKPYGGTRILTSLTPRWTKGEYYAKKEDWESLFEIVSKCPRGMNITGNLVFDQIDWYGDGVKEPALWKSLHDKETEQAEIFLSRTIINSQIIIGRQYDDGNKYNYVSIIIEATIDNDDKPRDTIDIIKKLEPYLGIPNMMERICRGSIEEEWQFQEKAWACGDLLKEKVKQVFPDEQKFNFNDDIEFVPNIANKKKIIEAFKRTSFEIGDRKGLLPGMNHVFCKDVHNHQYEILIDRTQNSPNYFYWYVDIKGYNFSISSEQNVMFASSEKEGSEKLLEIARFCERFVEEFGQTLFDNFGATPKWYRY